MNTTSFYSELGGVGGQRGDWGPGSGGEGRGEGSASAELVGRSGAAPPVIIRVTAARARLCAACTRRDVLPREKSEHLSVPPRRQQPPTSLSNSTQLVTRSPNSYFLSLAHSRTPTLNYSALLFLFCFTPLFADSFAHPLSLSLQDRLWKQQASSAVQIARNECMWYLDRNEFYVSAMLMRVAPQSSFFSSNCADGLCVICAQC